MKCPATLLLTKQLDFAGHRYEKEYRFDRARQWRADFYLPAGRLIVEVEGIGYGRSVGRHQMGSGYESDLEKYNRMTEMGFRLLRFSPKWIRGQMKTRKRVKIPPAIDVIDRFILGESLFESLDRTKEGYARR